MSNEMAIQIFLDTAGNDLSKVKDPYQHAMLALEIAKTISATGVQLTDLVKGAAEQAGKTVKPATKAKTTKKEELKGKPLSSKEEQAVNDILSVPNKAEKAAAENNGISLPADAPMLDLGNDAPTLVNMNPRAQIPTAAPAPAPAEAKAPAAPAVPEKPAIDITSDEWKNKHLTPSEVDDTWTDAMKANNEMLQSAKLLRQVCVNGVQSGKIDVDWLNARITEASDGMFTNYQDRNIYNPPVVRMISAYIAGKVNELFRKAA